MRGFIAFCLLLLYSAYILGEERDDTRSRADAMSRAIFEGKTARQNVISGDVREVDDADDDVSVLENVAASRLQRNSMRHGVNNHALEPRFSRRRSRGGYRSRYRSRNRYGSRIGQWSLGLQGKK